MTISDVGFALSCVFPDPDSEWLFNEDGSLDIMLLDTVGLTAMVDAHREQLGLLPMVPTSSHRSDYDPDGWYNFYIDVHQTKDCCTDAEILAIVESDHADDDRDEYFIKLSDDVRKALYQHLDAEAKKAFGYGFDELFAEAREYAERP